MCIGVGGGAGAAPIYAPQCVKACARLFVTYVEIPLPSEQKRDKLTQFYPIRHMLKRVKLTQFVRAPLGSTKNVVLMRISKNFGLGFARRARFGLWPC